LIFLQPVPTPEPISNQTVQLIQAMQKSYDATIQNGIVGVLQFIAFTTVILAAAIFIYVWTRRNNKPIDSNSGTNAAITALAEQLSAQNERYDETLEQQKQEAEANRKQYENITNKYIESLTAQSDATNNLADSIKRNVDENKTTRTDISDIKIAIQPLQQLVERVTGLELLVSEVKTNIGLDRESYGKILNELKDIKEIAIRAEQKKTSEMQKVDSSTTP